MHDSETTMLIRSKMAGINSIEIQTKRCIHIHLPLQAPDQNVPQTLTKILCENFPLWPKRTHVPDRQSHRTSH